MRLKTALSFLALGFFAACQGIDLPRGDAQHGRVVFAERGCGSCHRVWGEALPSPVAQPPVQVVLGDPQNRKTIQYLAESIINPSHRLAHPPARPVGDPGMILEQTEYEDMTSGGLSRMGESNHYLSVEDWIDLVAYLDAMQNRNLVWPRQRAAK